MGLDLRFCPYYNSSLNMVGMETLLASQRLRFGRILLLKFIFENSDNKYLFLKARYQRVVSICNNSRPKKV